MSDTEKPALAADRAAADRTRREADREARLAKALRDNLRRRKAPKADDKA